jgi:2Fe-2S ferredoxin
MPRLTIIEFDGTTHELDVTEGTSVMRAAIDANVRGILADCGGSCSCATCHCYVDEAWLDRVPGAEDAELEMLECASNQQSNSRLSCQLRMNGQTDGLVVRLPRSQT